MLCQAENLEQTSKTSYWRQSCIDATQLHIQLWNFCGIDQEAQFPVVAQNMPRLGESILCLPCLLYDMKPMSLSGVSDTAQFIYMPLALLLSLLNTCVACAGVLA